MKITKTRIVIAGEGGQGIQTIAELMSEFLFQEGLESIYLPSFGVEQRGAPSVAYLTVSSSVLRYDKFDLADVVIILQKRAIRTVQKYISPNTKIIFDSSTISVSSLPKNAVHLYGIPVTKMAHESGSVKSLNLIVVGALMKFFDYKDTASMWRMIESKLGKKFKDKEMILVNKTAFESGCDIFFERKNFTVPEFTAKHRSIVLKGHGKQGEILPKFCKGCGICIVKCPVGAISFGSDLGMLGNRVPEVDLEKCIACGNCRNFCPDGAINIRKT